MFAKMGPAPTPRSGHTMSVIGSRLFVLGGLSDRPQTLPDPAIARPGEEESSIVHVLETSKLLFPCFRRRNPLRVTHNYTENIHYPPHTSGHPATPFHAPTIPTPATVHTRSDTLNTVSTQPQPTTPLTPHTAQTSHTAKMSHASHGSESSARDVAPGESQQWPKKRKHGHGLETEPVIRLPDRSRSPVPRLAGPR